MTTSFQTFLRALAGIYYENRWCHVTRFGPITLRRYDYYDYYYSDADVLIKAGCVLYFWSVYNYSWIILYIYILWKSLPLWSVTIYVRNPSDDPMRVVRYRAAVVDQLSEVLLTILRSLNSGRRAMKLVAWHCASFFDLRIRDGCLSSWLQFKSRRPSGQSVLYTRTVR